MSGKEDSDNSGEGEGWESENLESSRDDWVLVRDEEGSSDSREKERDRKKKGTEGVKRRMEFEEGGRGRQAES